MKGRILCLVTALAVQGAQAQDNPPLGALPPLPGVEKGQKFEAMAELGKLLFFDSRLSGDGSLSCASCHDPSFGWSDGSDLARGYPATMHWRNSQTVVNAAFVGVGLHWDGEIKSLEDQVAGAMGTGFVANLDTDLAEERLRQVPEYVKRFEAIWQEEPTFEGVQKAIAAYERTLISDDSPFDKYMAGDRSAMSAAALRGMELFNGKANCIACHNGPMATDEKFHNTSVPPNPAFTEEPLRQVTFRLMMRKSGVDESIVEVLDRDPGRYMTSDNPEDLGAFRTPPLRYLKYTAPYMHSGVFYDLREVVEFYNAGGTDDYFGTKSPLIKPLGLNDSEMNDLVVFLESMSGSELRQEYPVLPEYEAKQFPVARAKSTIYAMANGKGGGTVQLAAAPAQAAGSEAADAGSTSKTIVGQGLLIVTTDGSKSSEKTASLTLQAPAKQEAKETAKPKVLQLSTQRSDTAAAPSRSTSRLASAAEPERTVVVARGDTLGSLANRFYGDFRQFGRIYEANRDKIENPNILRPGVRLVIP